MSSGLDRILFVLPGSYEQQIRATLEGEPYSKLSTRTGEYDEMLTQVDEVHVAYLISVNGRKADKEGYVPALASGSSMTTSGVAQHLTLCPPAGAVWHFEIRTLTPDKAAQLR